MLTNDDRVIKIDRLFYRILMITNEAIEIAFIEIALRYFYSIRVRFVQNYDIQTESQPQWQSMAQ